MLKYTNYPTKPRVLNIKKGDTLTFHKSGGVSFRPNIRHGLPFKMTEVQKDSVLDLLGPAFFGLIEDLVPGSPLAREFITEFEKFEELDNRKSSRGGSESWVFYPKKKHLVRFASAYWHRLALVIRNSTLQRDQKMILDWQQLCELKESAVISIAGCSIGNVALHAIVRDLRPRHIKVADSKNYHITNANRVALGYEDFGKNKAIITAEQLHQIDPFLKISVYDEGIHGGTIEHFLAGSANFDEPRTTVLVEEMDDIEMKIRVREKARQLGIPVIMMTDVGSAAQLDVRRFDKNKGLSLVHGVPDEKLFKVVNTFKKERTRETWYNFFITVVGRAALEVTEFRKIILKEDPPLFSGAPQLGSTAMTASGIAAEAIARLILGYKIPERLFFDKHTGKTTIEGKLL